MDGQSKLQGQPLYTDPELVAVTAALLGCRGKAACKTLCLSFHPTIKLMLLELYPLVSLSTDHFTTCPSLFSTTLLSCDFVCSQGTGCQTFF